MNCVKDYNKFYEVISKYKSQDREMFYDFQKELFESNLKIDLSIPDYHIASKYMYLLSQVWSGTNPQSGKFIDLKGKYRSKFDSFKNKLLNQKWQSYFDKISHVENLDFESAIMKYDSPQSFIYSDPPYYRLGEKYYSNHDFGEKDHERLANCLKSIKGRFAMSYYYFDQLEKWFPKDKYRWESQEFSKAAMAKKGKSQTKGVEILIMNY
jgi:DNA adenine methylase